MGKVKESAHDDVPIRVLHLIDRITGYGTTGLLWDIVRLTPPDKVQHFVITFSPDKGKWIYADLLREQGAYCQVPGWRILKILDHRPMTWFLVRYVTALWHVFKSLIWFRPDIIHVHTNYVLTIGLLLKVMLWRPVVHLVPSLFSQMTDSGKPWVPKLYARFHVLFDCFFTAASRSRDELLSVGIPESKIVPLRGILDLEEINAVRHRRQQYHKTIREKYHLPSDAVIALSVGRLDPSKGHIFVLEALPALLHQFPKLHWILVGSGKQYAELEARANTLKISSHVHLVGYQDDLLPYYTAATVYLRTMIFEETNLSTYKAMAMGLPIVGFDTGCETELLKKIGHGILVPNKSVEGLSAAIAQILALPDHGRGLGGRGIEFSQTNLDIRLGIEDITAVYKNLRDGIDINIKRMA
jgi:glycosyltransferase involved in cell wall biosynthesis